MIAIDQAFISDPHVRDLMRNFKANQLGRDFDESNFMCFRITWATAIICIVASYFLDSNRVNMIMDPDAIIAEISPTAVILELVICSADGCQGMS